MPPPYHFYGDKDQRFLCLAILESSPSVGCGRRSLPMQNLAGGLAEGRGGAVLF